MPKILLCFALVRPSHGCQKMVAGIAGRLFIFLTLVQDVKFLAYQIMAANEVSLVDYVSQSVTNFRYLHIMARPLSAMINDYEEY